ncbi:MULTISPECIES: major capsid protein [Acinetobacter]|uniref:major capsid protein n=1 Tax=Acinetobacter TaxID=469 RepID=UPI002448AD0D|nr:MULTISPECIES: major capsid protein [Acinetobacter]MDH0031345.1 major capsid protein [Acinetobacter sp. GD04021]MDH0887170.1 major capsid protein [Acinetobacter sp. GD03873]MDH1083541.1 major capsid protein [Acinetobacter sp. GD03983]MDH2190486.1 major capsid protein [Acinetobacter sp. GD03645]MDH2204068.1 major capsid protein [Acinetobacter sp. GD03647]
MSVSFTFQNAPVELLDIPQLVLLTDTTKKVDTWLMDRFFPQRVSYSKKEVPVGELNTATPLAPFVSPNVAGRQINVAESGKVAFVKPAYLKPMVTIVPSDVQDSALVSQLRRYGIVATGSNRLSDAELLLIDQAQKAIYLRQSIENRKLLIARDVLLYGKTTFASADFPSYTVDYNRDAACNFAPLVKWNLANATPVQDMQSMINISVEYAGVAPNLALTSSKVFNALIQNDEFKEKFIKPYASISVPITPTFDDPAKPQFRGTVDNVQIWTYDGTHNMNGSVERFIPEDFFGMISDANGWMAHCAIQNIEAFGQALEFFLTQWQEKNPSSIQMLAESSPLAVPNNKNGLVGGRGFV